MSTRNWSGIVRRVCALSVGAFVVWTSTLSAQDQPTQKSPGKIDKSAESGDLNKEVEDALKELERLKAKPEPSPNLRPQPGGGGGGLRQLLLLRTNRAPANPGRLGIALRKPTAAIAEQLKLPEGQGQIVNLVRPDSPAEKAGFQKNDVILEFDGVPVPAETALFQQMIRDAKAGTPINAVVLRNGQKQAIKNIVLQDVANENLDNLRPPARRPTAPDGGLDVPNARPVPQAPLQKKATPPAVF